MLDQWRLSGIVFASVFLIVTFLVTGIILVNYLVTVESLNEETRLLRTHSEEMTSSAFNLVNTGLEVYDNTFNDEVYEGFETVMAAYDKSGGDISRMDLHSLSSQIRGMGIHVINESAVIVKSTDPAENLLDFSVIYPDFAVYLSRIINQSGFFPDRVSMEYYSGNLTKYAYMPTPDHRYIIELSLAVDDFTRERSRLNYTPYLDHLSQTNPDIVGYRLFAKNFRLLTNTSYKATEDEQKILRQVLDQRRSVELTYPEEGKSVKYLLIDLRNDQYAADKSVIVEITYLDERIRDAMKRIQVYHCTLAIVAIIGGLLLSLFVSERLSRPIEQMVRDVDRIADGDLNHSVRSGMGIELSLLQESMNRLIASIRTLVQNLREEEQRVIESEIRYREVFETQRDLICRFRPGGGSVFVNDAYRNFFSVSGEEIQGSCFNPHAPGDLQDQDQLVLQSLTPQKPSGIMDQQITLKDGSIRWVQWSILAFFDRTGFVQEYQLTGRDITEMKTLQENLRQSDLLYRSTIDAMTDGVYVINRSYKVLLFNSSLLQWLDIFSISDVPVIGSDLFSLFPFFSTNLREGYESVWRSGEVLVSDEEYRPAGREFHVEIRIIPILIDGKVEKIVTILRDVTEKKKTEQSLLNLNRMLEEEVKIRTRELEETILELDSFSYTVSHDLRAPIRAIDGFSYILSMKADSGKIDEFKYYFEKIHDNVRQMDRLIDDLLNFSRMSKHPINCSLIDMRSLVSEVVSELSALHRGTHFDITIGDLPPTEGDPTLIRQVFINLISNAMKFSQNQPSPAISIGYLNTDGKGEYTVQDNGIGFDMQYADKIFEVFMRLHLSEEYEGTGVGLAIVKRIISRHGGQIRARSVEGAGSIFFFTLGGRYDEE